MTFAELAAEIADMDDEQKASEVFAIYSADEAVSLELFVGRLGQCVLVPFILGGNDGE